MAIKVFVVSHATPPVIWYTAYTSTQKQMSSIVNKIWILNVSLSEEERLAPPGLALPTCLDKCIDRLAKFSKTTIVRLLEKKLIRRKSTSRLEPVQNPTGMTSSPAPKSMAGTEPSVELFLDMIHQRSCQSPDSSNGILNQTVAVISNLGCHTSRRQSKFVPCWHHHSQDLPCSTFIVSSKNDIVMAKKLNEVHNFTWNQVDLGFTLQRNTANKSTVTANHDKPQSWRNISRSLIITVGPSVAKVQANTRNPSDSSWIITFPSIWTSSKSYAWFTPWSIRDMSELMFLLSLLIRRLSNGNWIGLSMQNHLRTICCFPSCI